MSWIVVKFPNGAVEVGFAVSLDEQKWAVDERAGSDSGFAAPVQ